MSCLGDMSLPLDCIKRFSLTKILYYNGNSDGSNTLDGESKKYCTFENPKPIITRRTGMNISTSSPLKFFL